MRTLLSIYTNVEANVLWHTYVLRRCLSKFIVTRSPLITKNVSTEIGAAKIITLENSAGSFYTSEIKFISIAILVSSERINYRYDCGLILNWKQSIHETNMTKHDPLR